MDTVIETAFQQGGMALAFVLTLIMYRELWQKRFDELLKYAKQLEASNVILLDALQKATSIEERLINTVDQMMQESRARMAEILIVSRSAETAIISHLPAAQVAAEEAKKSSEASRATGVAVDKMAVVAEIRHKNRQRQREKDERDKREGRG